MRPAAVTIPLGPDEPRVIAAAIAALARRADIYVSGGMLARIATPTDPQGIPCIERLPASSLQEHLADAAIFVGARGERVHPPRWLVTVIRDRGNWPGIRLLRGITEMPVLRVDGSCLTQPGYDRQSGLYYAPCCDPPDIPDRPSALDVLAAQFDLQHVVVDVCFATDAHKAAWMAYLFTLVAQFAFTGPSPLTLIDASTPAAGKGLLATVAALIATGRAVPATPATESDDEMRKRVTALAASGARAVLLDNVVGMLGGAALCVALTLPSGQWTDRWLGVNRMWRGPLHIVWAATGNGVQLGPDMVRRAMYVRLEPDTDEPQLRTGFVHEKWLSFVHTHRSRLISAALTILRAYHVAGRPPQPLRPWGSFEGWSDLVRGAVVWAGWPDPAEASDDLRRADPELEALHDLIDGLAMLPELRSADIVRAAYAMEEPMLRDAFAVLCDPRGYQATPVQVGKMLARYRDRIIRGRRIRSRLSRGRRLWRVV